MRTVVWTVRRWLGSFPLWIAAAIVVPLACLIALRPAPVSAAAPNAGAASAGAASAGAPAAQPAAPSKPLTVVGVGPTGELSSLAEGE